MPLDNRQRLAVLSDILRSHQLECCGTASEYEQADRITQLILNDSEIQQDLRDALSGIQQYTSQGTVHNQPEQHILQNQTHITEWLQTLDHFQ